ncbi:MAG TPA: hypothetical protein VLE43_09740 [Candidatus Saccharimonadia bacterium]|nr:hypothetical protein [Candidatus Saccharimonadia bacterium]
MKTTSRSSRRSALITYHPSALLRAPDEQTRDRQYAEFMADLKLVAKRLG